MMNSFMNNRSFYSLSVLLLMLLLIGLTQTVSAQEKKSSRKSGKHSQPIKQNFVPEKQINLVLKGCSGAIHLGSTGLDGNALEIDGERIAINGAQGQSWTGEVRAYARSAYWLDANLGLIFGRPTVPLTDAAWKPPTIISLILVQDRKHLRRLTLSPAEGLNRDFPTTVISCASVSGSQ